MDRLSELPDSVIFHIFWSLPMWDVVRTTILSKRWLNLWTTTPFLNFGDPRMHFGTVDRFRNFVQRALLRWDGVRVLKFKVESDTTDEEDCEPIHEDADLWDLPRKFEPIHEDVDLWVRFAKKFEVEELYLHMVIQDDHESRSGDIDDLIHWVPQFLYSCSSLKVLSIENCYFRIKGNVQWNHLKSLTISRGYGVTEDVMNQILCGSPQLEVLIMSFFECSKSLCIRSNSLKELSINKHLYDYDASTYTTTELRIWTPNLKTLEIKGVPFSKCLLMNVSSLNRATLGCYGLHHYGETHWYHRIDGFTSHFLGDLFGQILPSIQHVEHITLSSCCDKGLGAMIEGYTYSSYPNVKSLLLRFHYFKFVSMIEISPPLKKLVIEVRERCMFSDLQNSLGVDREIYLELKKNIPMCFVLQLRTIEVTFFEGLEADIVFPLLEFLLKNASKLEKIVFRVKGPLNSLLRASQKLMKMPRSSRTALFTFGEY
ncbi:F-box/FBD/LRR-repeat protein At5g56420-like [Salvia miltiorrhiza]|uniref:F-box/FBD/LRR-repeat protein At5g56420-like n=1 Tax=Salvia miltiorrhiza TaxID=226208 RepID=UPI0025AC8528|nr:F-box/FBD/LRR-repeat protein At5g56420-like [Salvia miltiorrhiza]